MEGGIMPKSVLEAIKLGIWHFEPEAVDHRQGYDAEEDERF